MTLSKQALERAVMALNEFAERCEGAIKAFPEWKSAQNRLKDEAANDRAAAKEIQDYLDAKEGQQ